MTTPIAAAHGLVTRSALTPHGARRGAIRYPHLGANHAWGRLSTPRTAPRGGTAARVFSPGRPQNSGDGNDLTRERVSAESIARAAQKAERQKAALRTARSAAGVSRAEALRVGIEHRCALSLMDALPVDDALGASEDGYQSATLLFERAKACDDELASRFGLKAAGVSSETDLDRVVLGALHARMDDVSRRALLSGKFAHRHASVLSSLLLENDTYVQRFSVKSEFAIVVLTATFVLDERLAPCYKSASVVENWALKEITGEDSSEASEDPGAAEGSSAE